MSWLLVALIPGLLMLATLGLERVEASLRRDAISATDVAEFLNQAEAGDVETLAGGGMNGALHGMQRRLDDWDLPTHQDFPDRANPEFQQTRHANPV